MNLKELSDDELATMERFGLDKPEASGDTDTADLIAAYDAAGRMPAGTMTHAQWAVFSKLYNVVGRIVDAVEAHEQHPLGTNSAALEGANAEIVRLRKENAEAAALIERHLRASKAVVAQNERLRGVIAEAWALSESPEWWHLQRMFTGELFPFSVAAKDLRAILAQATAETGEQK